MDKMDIKKKLLKQLLEEMKEEAPVVELEEEGCLVTDMMDDVEDDYQEDEYQEEDYMEEDEEDNMLSVDIIDVFAKMKDNDKEVIVDPKPIVKSKKFRKKR